MIFGIGETAPIELVWACSDVIISAMASQSTGVSIVYSTVCAGADQRKHQRSASPAFMRGINRWPGNSPHKGLVRRKCFHLMTSSCIIDIRLDSVFSTYSIYAGIFLYLIWYLIPYIMLARIHVTKYIHYSLPTLYTYMLSLLLSSPWLYFTCYLLPSNGSRR